MCSPIQVSWAPLERRQLVQEFESFGVPAPRVDGKYPGWLMRRYAEYSPCLSYREMAGLATNIRWLVRLLAQRFNSASCTKYMHDIRMSIANYKGSSSVIYGEMSDKMIGWVYWSCLRSRGRDLPGRIRAVCQAGTGTINPHNKLLCSDDKYCLDVL